MSINPIDGINGIEMLNVTKMEGLKTEGFSRTDFADWLGQGVQSVNQDIQAADQAVRQLAVGETDNLHQVMISLSKAQTSFELAVQVRNRLLEGFQEIMRMSV
jgi:flagellar hook-basal body complex protein FliE